MKKLLFLLNPRAGKEKIRDKLIDVLNVFVREGYEVTIYLTQKRGDAVRAVRELLPGKDRLVICGGDGTVNEAVTGLLDIPEKERIPVGYIPAGSTNDYAVSLGLSPDPLEAARTAAGNTFRSVDIGSFGGRKFVYVAAFGAFTEISWQTPQDIKNILGHQAYILESVKSFLNLRPYSMAFSWEGNTVKGDFIIGMIANSLSIGGIQGLFGGDVLLDDGQFEVLLVKQPKTPADLAEIASFLLFREGAGRCVHVFKTDFIRAEAFEKVEWALDGEYGGGPKEAEIRVLPKAVEFAGSRLPKKAGSKGLDILPENMRPENILDSLRKSLDI